MLEVGKLTVSYGAHRALEDVSVHVAKGEICVILGANGAGKSSLLKAISGLVRASGDTRVSIDGKDITHAKAHRVVEAGLALVPEGRGIFGDLTVAENLQLGAYGKQARANEAKRREQVLRLFPRLEERRNQIARTMSGGEQQMVAIGRALMSNPTILMLDEPSLGLSPLLTKDLFKSLRAVRETGVGILLVEQNAKQSLAIADRGYLIENGHITGEGSGAELSRDPAVQAAYLGAVAAETSHSRPKMDNNGNRLHLPITAVGKDDGSALALAQRAARVQRDYVNVLRECGRHINGYINGHGHRIAHDPASHGDAIKMNPQASKLSRRAVEFVQKATRIQREYVEGQRVGYHLAAASRLAEAHPVQGEVPVPVAEPGSARLAHDLASHAPEFAARAAAIQKKHIVMTRSALAEQGIGVFGVAEPAGKKLKGRKRKLARKAEKLARKAARLAEKAAR
jgi:ABC-type branched-subunit amino acid transport system ATPase component